jgi:hypothetical protein
MPRSDVSIRATNRVFNIPEIIHLICKLLEKSDLARLLAISRSSFACAAPVVWNTIPGPKPLLSLLPDDAFARVEGTRRANVSILDCHTDLVYR